LAIVQLARLGSPEFGTDVSCASATHILQVFAKLSHPSTQLRVIT